MQITAICNPLAGLQSTAVAQIFRNQWLKVRADSASDDVHAIKSTHGRVAQGAGTGLAQVLFDEIGFLPDQCQLLDFAQLASWRGGKVPLASSFGLGLQLRRVLCAKPKQIWIHLPRFSQYSDLGLGLLTAFLPEQQNFQPSQFASASLAEFAAVLSDELLQGCIALLRELTRDVTVTITYSDDQQLLGFSGMAKSWTHYGVQDEIAQQAERIFGKLAARIEKLSGAKVMFTSPKQMPFAGVGGGLGFLFNTLGFQVHQVNQLLVSNDIFAGKLHDAINQADVVFYICEPLGEEIPTGLTQISELTKEVGVPLVLISEFSSLRKGDLPRLGLSGSYDLYDASDGVDERDNAVQDLPALFTENQAVALSDIVQRCARTWGW